MNRFHRSTVGSLGILNCNSVWGEHLWPEKVNCLYKNSNWIKKYKKKILFVVLLIENRVVSMRYVIKV